MDPAIVEHRIDTWPDAIPVRQKQRPIHPAKAPAIKAQKLTSSVKLVLLNQLLILRGCPTQSPSIINKEPFAFVSTFVIWISRAQKRTTRRLSSTKLSMHVQDMRFYPSWMDSMGTIKSESALRISIRLLSLLHGGLSPTKSCPSGSRTLVPPSSVPCNTVLMTCR